jgi:hypothetical protein
MSLITFELYANGMISIDTSQCNKCSSKACALTCQNQYIDGPIVIEKGKPALKYTLDEIKQGACVECLGCELSCLLDGLGVIKINLPLPELDEYLESIDEEPVYRRKFK